ncbi:MAG: hypothetical protein QW418_05685 [Candidatus Korarchaeum sp.]
MVSAKALSSRPSSNRKEIPRFKSSSPPDPRINRDSCFRYFVKLRISYGPLRSYEALASFALGPMKTSGRYSGP